MNDKDSKTLPDAGWKNGSARRHVVFVVPAGMNLQQAYQSSCRIYVSSIKHRTR